MSTKSEVGTAVWDTWPVGARMAIERLERHLRRARQDAVDVTDRQERREMTGKCANCGCESRSLKRGWTNALYCGESCEKQAVSGLHASMPGGPSPRPGWMPQHIAREIAYRWSDEQESAR